MSQNNPNLRKKQYAILMKHKETGEISSIIDVPMRLDISTKQCLVWDSPNDRYQRSFQKKYPEHDVFIVRIGSKNCPIEVDRVTRGFRYPLNLNFKTKEIN